MQKLLDEAALIQLVLYALKRFVKLCQNTRFRREAMTLTKLTTVSGNLKQWISKINCGNLLT